MSEIKNSTATVFLGGTCNDSTWRDELIPQLSINYFNPVVPDWNEEAYKRELEARENSEFCLYVLTPKMTGVYSIAEVVDDSNKRPEKTVFCFLEKDGDLEFDKHQLKSLVNTGKMVKNNGATVLGSLAEVAEYLNKAKK